MTAPAFCSIRTLGLAVLLVSMGLVGCSTAPPTTFDLGVPASTVRQASGGPQLVVAEPVALQTLDSDRIIVTAADGSLSAIPGAQWSDRLPRLVQTRLVQTFENAGRAVGRAGGPLAATRTLYSDLRRFGIVTAGSPLAVVEITAKIVDTQSGRIVSSRIFRAAVPVGVVGGREAAAALDQASMKVFSDIVRWTAGRG